MKKSKPTLNPADVTLLIGAMKVVFSTPDEVRKIVKEEIKFLPTKEEFASRMDKLSGEIQKVRDEQILHAGDHQRIDRRLTRVEKHIKLSTFVD